MARAELRRACEGGPTKAEFQRVSSDPLYWVDNYGSLLNPKASRVQDRVLPFKLWPKQRELGAWLLDGYRQSSDLPVDQVLNKAREIGATWLAMHLTWWLWRFERGFSCLLISRKEQLVEDPGPTGDSLFGKFDHITKSQPAWLVPRIYGRHLLRLNEGMESKVVGETTSAGVGRSTRHSLVIVDEAAHIEANKQQAIKVSLESVANAKWWLSTPKGRGNEFAYMVTARKQNPEASRRTYFELDWTANPTRTDEWFESLLIDHGGSLTWDERAQEHDCSLAGVSGIRVWKVPGEGSTYSDEDLPVVGRRPEPGRRSLLAVGAMDFGSGPSWTVCVWVLVDPHRSPHPHYPLIYVDGELVWSRVAAPDIGEQITAYHQAGYGENFVYIGDPAGKAAESDQESWETRLRANGVPVTCLPAAYNQPDILNQAAIDEVQKLADAGLLRLHESRVPLVRQTMESWEWDLPEGIQPRDVNRANLSPRKDSWSHLGNALCYAVAWVLRSLDDIESVADVASSLPAGSGGVLADLYGQITARR